MRDTGRNKVIAQILKKLPIQIRDGERGFALILVLVLLLIGGLIIIPLMSFMSAGVIATQLYENLMLELYSADAGVENAIWQLMSFNVTVPDGGTVGLPDITVNDKVVKVVIENKGNQVYEISSVSFSVSGSTTGLLVHTTGLDFSAIAYNAITSLNDVTFQPGATVNGTVVENYSGDWPSAKTLINYYKRRVDTSSLYGSNKVDIKYIPLILPTGTIYRDGNLDIVNSGTPGALGTLNDYVYVTGDLDVGLTNKDFTLDLNGKGIFVEGEIDIGGKCTLTGVGCIVAIGDIYFAPQVMSDPNDFIFIMSIEGTIFMNPQGDFYGSLAGDTEVQLQPGCSIIWRDPSGDEIGFPDGSIDEPVIIDWLIVD